MTESKKQVAGKFFGKTLPLTNQMYQAQVWAARRRGYQLDGAENPVYTLHNLSRTDGGLIGGKKTAQVKIDVLEKADPRKAHLDNGYLLDGRWLNKPQGFIYIIGTARNMRRYGIPDGTELITINPDITFQPKSGVAGWKFSCDAFCKRAVRPSPPTRDKAYRVFAKAGGKTPAGDKPSSVSIKGQKPLRPRVAVDLDKLVL